MRRALASLIVVAAGCGAKTSNHFVTPPGDGGGPADLNFTFADDGGKQAPCHPGDPPVCEGDSVVKTCNAQGTGWDSLPCPDATTCMGGVCICTPGDRQCSGQDALLCDANGVFQVDRTCPMGTSCMAGTCGDKRCIDEVMSTNPNALPTIGWPRFRHDNRSSGVTPAVVAAMPKLKWKQKIGGTNLNGGLFGFAGGPVVNQNDVVFIGGGDGDGMNGSYYSYDAAGKALYTFPGKRGYGFTTPAVRQDGTSYFSTADGHAYAVDLKGQQVWNYSFGFQNDCHPIVTRDGIVIYGSDNGQLFALDFMGVLQWKSDVNTGPGEVDSALAESCDGKIYAGGANGWFQLDAKTGLTNWKVPTTGSFKSLMSSPTVTADGIMYGVDSGGVIYAIDPMGKVLWQKATNLAGAGTAVLALGGFLYVVLNDGNLHALDAAQKGVETWSKPVGQMRETYVHPGPVADGKNQIFYNSTDGFLYAFDVAGHQLWRQAHSGQASTGCCYGNIAIGRDGTLYVPGNDGTLYVYQ